MLCFFSGKRLFFVLLLLLLVIISSGTAIYAELNPQFILYKAPFNYFEIPVPKDWRVITTEWFGGREYIFSPQQITLEQFEKGIDLQTIFLVKISRHPDGLLKNPYFNIKYLEYARHFNPYMGSYVQFELGPDQKIFGVEGSNIKARFPDKSTANILLALKDRLMYEFHYYSKDSQYDTYLPVFQKMIQGMKILDYSCHEETKAFSFKVQKVQGDICLPKSWSLRQYCSDGTYKLFITREPHHNILDAFKVGVSITEIPIIQEPLKFPSERERAIALAKKILIPSQRILALLYQYDDQITLNGCRAVIAERSYTFIGQEGFTQEYHVFIGKVATLYDIVLKAPVREFEVYSDIYWQAISSINLMDLP